MVSKKIQVTGKAKLSDSLNFLFKICITIEITLIIFYLFILFDFILNIIFCLFTLRRVLTMKWALEGRLQKMLRQNTYERFVKKK